MSLQECAKSASEYWTSELPNELGENAKHQFQRKLEQAIIRKYTGHWYPGNPKKGSGYRAMACTEEAGMEPMIKDAATSSGIAMKHLQGFTRKVLFVDPGIVAVFDARQPWFSVPIFRSKPMPPTAEDVEEKNHHTNVVEQQQQQQQQQTILREKNTNIMRMHQHQTHHMMGKMMHQPFHLHQNHHHMVTVNTAQM